MKKFLLIPALAIAAIGFSSCSNNRDNNKTTDVGTASSAEEHNEAKFNNDNEKDAQFVVDAVNENLNAIALSNLAMTRTSHPELKEFAKAVSDHHTKINNELVQLAQKKNITVPTSADPDNSDYQALNKKTTGDFEQSFYNKAVDMHRDAISRYEKAAQDCRDADIRNYAAEQLPALRTHLDRAMNDQKMAENWK